MRCLHILHILHIYNIIYECIPNETVIHFNDDIPTILFFNDMLFLRPPVLPFAPGVMPVLGPLPMPGPFMGQGPHVGLLPPPPPVMEESRNADDRILDASEFYSIQRELRRLAFLFFILHIPAPRLGFFHS